jgi:hypothetical protein
MTALFESVLRISAEAAVLVLLVLGARLIVSRRPGVMLCALCAYRRAACRAFCRLQSVKHT